MPASRTLDGIFHKSSNYLQAPAGEARPRSAARCLRMVYEEHYDTTLVS
jgi:hypothetical protein